MSWALTTDARTPKAPFSVGNASLASHERSAASHELRGAREAVSKAIVKAASVVVCSCIGAHQLLEEPGDPFSLVVLDEGSQTTEPALVCALAAAQD